MHKSRTIFIAIGLSVIWIIGLSLFLLYEKTSIFKSSSALPSTPISISGKAGNNYVPVDLRKDKAIFIDSIVVLTKEKPHKAMLLSSRRNDLGNGEYSQIDAVSWFNGGDWQRESMSLKTQSPNISPSELVSIQSQHEKNKLFNEMAHFNVEVNGDRISGELEEIKNQMAMRTFPYYTKFISNGETTLSVNGREEEAYYAYLKTYSMDLDKVIVYQTDLGINTFWVAFWDESGTFYHIDTTEVENDADNYGDHSIAFKSITLQRSTLTERTDSVDISYIKTAPPEKMNISLPFHTPSSLQINTTNHFKKFEIPNTDWYISIADGVVQSKESQLKGIGLVEYIDERPH